MTTIQPLQSGTNLLQTALAKPYHYRRSGRYYLRLRPQGTTASFFTLSLRTTNKATAMTISQEILQTLKAFHFDNPEATWKELRERLEEIAESCLTMAHGDDSLWAYEMINDEQHAALREASAKLPLSVNQHRAVQKALEIIEAAQQRLKGRPGKLVEIVRDLRGESCSSPVARSSLSLSVGPSKDPVTWETLSALYMAEHSINLKEDSRDSAMTVHKTIGESFKAIGVADLRAHTREDLIKLRTHLLTGRKPSTVNNHLAKLGAVLTWAVRSDKLVKQYSEKLKLTKGADSTREAFSRDQVVNIMAHAKTLPVGSWERWSVSLLAITGARVGEVAGLTKADIQEVDGYWCININEDSPGKSIKNKHSARKVPLVDGALGFDLKGFLEAVAAGALPSDNGVNKLKASRNLGVLIRDALGTAPGGNLTLHSLRHHFSGSLKNAGVPVAYAQAALGHSSRTIAFDNYGAGVDMKEVHGAIQKGLS